MGNSEASFIDNQFSIKGTEDRTGSKYNYVICVSESIKKKLGTFAVVEHRHENYEIPLRAYGRVLVNNTLNDDEVMLDQTLRIAIGISYNNDSFYGFNERVKLYPLKLNLMTQLNNFIASKVAIRYLYCRYNIPNIVDAEKNLVRVPEDTFDLLGCKNGDTVICEFPAKVNGEFILKTYKVQGYIATESMIDKREEIENNEDDSNHSRYLSALKLFGLQPDIPRIFMDYHIREGLQTRELQPISVRRDVKGLFLKQIIEFGIVSMVTLITLVSVLPGDITWKKLILTSLTSLILSIALVLMNIRSTLK